MKNFRHIVTIPLSQLLDKVFVVSAEGQTTLLDYHHHKKYLAQLVYSCYTRTKAIGI